MPKGLKQSCCESNLFLIFCSDLHDATAELALLDSRNCAATIDDLRTYWHEEAEPESKLALAELVISDIVEVDKWRPIVRPDR